jgi:predicted secreted protein
MSGNKLWCALIASLCISACGGGGGDGDGDDGGNNQTNQLPTANAGADQFVLEKEAVIINGTGSDSDGSVVSYAWTQTTGTTVTLSGADSATLSFDAPDIDVETVLTFQLQVTDDDGAVDTDSVNINVDNIFAPEVALVSEITLQEQTSASLQAQVTQTTYDITSIAWTQVSGDTLNIDSATNSDTVQITTPSIDQDAVATLRVTVTDSIGQTAQADVIVTIEAHKELTLIGKVTDEVIANARVCAQEIDSAETCSNADANGDYLLTLEELSSNSLITLTATGQASQSFVTFKSQLGTVATLLERAGSDKVLTKDEDFGVNITNVTTAKYALILSQVANIDDDFTLAFAIGQLSPKKLIEYAAAIKVVVDNADIDLPDGISSTLDLVANSNVIDDFIEALNIEHSIAFDTAIAAIFEDANLLPEVDGLVFNGSFILADLQNSESAFKPFAIAFNQDNTATISSSYMNAESANWQLVGNQMRVDLINNPLYLTTHCLDNSEKYECHVFADSMQIDWIVQGSSYDLVKVVISQSQTDPSGSHPDRLIEETYYLNLIKDSEITELVIEDFVDKQWSLPTYNASSVITIANNKAFGLSAAQMLFNADNTGSYRDEYNDDVDFNWNINESGQLIVEVSLTDNQDYTWTYSQIKTGISNLFVLSSYSATSDIRTYQMTIGNATEVTTTSSFTELTLPGKYDLYLGGDARSSEVITILPDGIAYKYIEEKNSISSAYHYYDWSIVDGLLTFTNRVYTGTSASSLEWNKSQSCEQNCDSTTLTLIAMEGTQQYSHYIERDGDMEQHKAGIIVWEKRDAITVTQRLALIDFYAANSGFESAIARIIEPSSEVLGKVTSYDGEFSYNLLQVGGLDHLVINQSYKEGQPNIDCNNDGILAPERQVWRYNGYYLVSSNERKAAGIADGAQGIKLILDASITYPDNAQCADLEERLISETLNWGFKDSDLGTLEVTEGQYAFEINKHTEADASYAYAWIAEFQTGGVGSLLHGLPQQKSLTWAEQSGRLTNVVVDMDDTRGDFSVEILGVVKAANGESLVLTINENAKPTDYTKRIRTSNVGQFMHVDTDLSLSFNDMVGTYIVNYVYEDGHSFVLNYNYDGFGTLANVTDGSFEHYRWLHWTVQNNEMIAYTYTQYTDSDGDGIADDANGNGVPDSYLSSSISTSEEATKYCAANSQACGIAMDRRYMPIRVIGDKVYLFRHKLVNQYPATDSFNLTEPSIITHSMGSMWMFNKQSGKINQIYTNQSKLMENQSPVTGGQMLLNDSLVIQPKVDELD